MSKKLCAKKAVETQTLATLTSAANKSLCESVKAQFTAMIMLPSEYNYIYSEVNCAGFSILRTGHRLDEYSKALSGYIPTLKTRELGTLLAALCERARPFFQRKNMLLFCNLGTERFFANVDEESFYYAVLELLLNAIEHSAPCSKVYVTLTSTKTHIKIEVKDNGCGMDSDTKSLCCDPFFSTKEGKTGLGLALVQNFAKNLGGRLSVSSKPGKGSIFTILLPKNNIEIQHAESPNVIILGPSVSPVEIMLG